MPITRRSLVASAGLAAALPAAGARAAAKPSIKLGVLTDFSGAYAAITGNGSLACTRQAATEFTAANPGVSVEVISADHQSKPDLGVSIAQQWFDREGVDAIVGGATSSVALAVNTVIKEKNKVFLDASSATPDLTGKQCTPNTVHFSYDIYMASRSTGETLVKSGGSTWYFVAPDYVFGHELTGFTERFVKKGGGKVLGVANYPFPGTTDFSSYLLRAKASGAKIIGLANAGTDTENCIKQAHEFHVLEGGARLAGLLVLITVVHSVGAAMAQGLVCTESFYWDMNDRTRAFTKRVLPRMPKEQRPNMVQAGCYSATLHYLKSAAKLGVDAAKKDGRAAVRAMKAMPVVDDAFGTTSIRADGRQMLPAYLFQVKSPSEMSGPWDYYKLLATTPAEEAAVPLAATGCYLDKA